MAATAYAALISLMNVITRYQHPTCPCSFNQLQMQTPLQSIGLLVKFLETCNAGTRSNAAIERLERKMSSAAYAAEDMIETCYVNQVLKAAGNNYCPDSILFLPNLKKTIKELDFIIEESMRLLKEEKVEDMQEIAPVASFFPWKSKNMTVGVDKQLSRLIDRVTLMHNPSREIIPIVGMGGIGKTALASKLYNHVYVGQFFDIQAWVTISQHYVFKDIILCLLYNINVCGNDEMDDDELGTQLHKGLWGKKYLIILDDIWSTDAWDEIRRLFPDDENGSRILLTTRLWSVARSVGSSRSYNMDFLDDDKSLNLLSETIYGQEGFFPPNLVIIGKKIAKSCKGLPLSIVVVGGLLKVSPKTPEYWANVAKNVSSIVRAENDGQCLKILSLSYKHLPIHLKPCLLYMATFTEDGEVKISDLIKLWVADGFIRPNEDRVLEDVALQYLNDLISRNLIMVGKIDLTGKTETCTVHDLLKKFYLREAQREKFLCVIEEERLVYLQNFEIERRRTCISSQKGCYSLLPSMKNARSCISKSKNSPKLDIGCRLLRVLYVGLGAKLPKDCTQLVNIRYLRVTFTDPVPSWFATSICSFFWNLETLILHGHSQSGKKLILLYDVWDLPHIRHVECTNNLLVAFPDPGAARTDGVLKNLQTIVTITPSIVLMTYLG